MQRFNGTDDVHNCICYGPSCLLSSGTPPLVVQWPNRALLLQTMGWWSGWEESDSTSIKALCHSYQIKLLETSRRSAGCAKSSTCAILQVEYGDPTQQSHHICQLGKISKNSRQNKKIGGNGGGVCKRNVSQLRSFNCCTLCLYGGRVNSLHVYWQTMWTVWPYVYEQYIHFETRDFVRHFKLWEGMDATGYRNICCRCGGVSFTVSPRVNWRQSCFPSTNLPLCQTQQGRLHVPLLAW